MANNRIYIECMGCKEPDLLYIAKRMRDGYYTNTKGVDPDIASDWFDKHKRCGGSEDHFRLYYENMPNYDASGSIEAILEQKAHPTPGTVK